MINVFILAEELHAQVVGAPHDARYALPLRTARLWSPALRSLRPDCLYVVGASELAAARQRAPHATFALAAPEPVAAREPGAALLVLEEDMPPEALLDRVLGVFERFDAAEAAMISDAIDGKDAQTVLRHTAAILANPIVLSDSALGFITRTDRYYPAAHDSVWDAISPDGYFEDASLPPELFQRAEKSLVPTFYDLCGVRTLQSCIRQDGAAAGFIGSTELIHAFSDGEVAKICWLNAVLARIWPLIIQSVHRWSEAEQVVIRAIDGDPVNQALVSRTLDALSWSADDAYRVLAFYRVGNCVSERDATQISGALKRAFPFGFVLALGDEALVILRGDHVDAPPSSGDAGRLMERHQLCCAVSMVWNAFEDIDKAYEQCAIVRSMAEQADAAPGTIWSFSDVLIAYLLQTLRTGHSLEVLCHPQVTALMQRGHGPEFVHSLRLYLANGRSMSRAARALYVHRSSLTYRIEQIERTLGFSLDEADEGTLVHLYLSCMILEERKEPM